MTASPPAAKPRSTISWIATLSLVVAGLAIVGYAALNIATAGAFAAVILLFAVIFFVFAFGSWREKRWGYLGGAIYAIIIFILFGFSVAGVLYNPGNSYFATSFLLYIADIIAIIYGLYGFYTAKRPSTTPNQIPRSSTLALIAVGVVIGGLLVGGFAGVTQNQLLTNRKHFDVQIVFGAAALTNTAFSPYNFNVSVGETVTWFNGDNTIHTVTSTASPSGGAFDSGGIPSGQYWTHTFNQVGTYKYYCSIHPNMIGIITVTS